MSHNATQNIFVQMSPTPNPMAMKFLPLDCYVSPHVSMSFAHGSGNLHRSQLAQDLLDLEGVQEVFYGPDFISVTANSPELWGDLGTQVVLSIIAHQDSILKGELLKDEGASEEEELTYNPEDEETVSQIRQILDEEINPRVAMDGGEIKFLRYEKGIAYFKLRGACASCPSATTTLYDFVREYLISCVPELVDVERIED